jgi:hypothetical protein
MGQSICAERSAITKLREIAYDRILAVYLVSDLLATELAPGLLCREFLCEVLEPDTPIIMAAAAAPAPSSSSSSAAGAAAADAKSGAVVAAAAASSSPTSSTDNLSYSCRIATLRTMYPHPPLFLHVRGAALVDTAQAFARDKAASVVSSTSHAAVRALYRSACEQAAGTAQKDELHPLRYVGAALFANGHTKLVGASKLLEYGHSLDPITKMLAILEDYKAQVRRQDCC